jgi:hypothetical protein
LANTGAGLVQWPRKTVLSLSLFTLLGVSGAARPQSIVQPHEMAQTPEVAKAPAAEASAAEASAEAPVTDEARSAAAAQVVSGPPSPDSTRSEGSSTSPQTPTNDGPPKPEPDVSYRWLDKTRQTLYDSMWRSAEHVDRWFGSVEDDTVYQQVYGSIAPALLYSQYNGVRAQVRFNMNFPLPEANDRLHAFVGRFDPNEFVTERDEPSGAIPRTYGPPTEDQTLLGIGYHQPDRTGSRFDAGTGVRLSVPLDPYIKGSYIFERGQSESGLFSVRETLFWQNSDGIGETTRLDLERIFDRHWLVRYTLSGTRSQMSQGVRGYSSILLLHGMPNRRAFAFEVGIDGQTDALVPLHDYGCKIAYRQGIVRRWLIMEVRTSVDWPKDYPWQNRSASLGVGLGFEMLLGTEAFLARPVTF